MTQGPAGPSSSHIEGLGTETGGTEAHFARGSQRDYQVPFKIAETNHTFLTITLNVTSNTIGRYNVTGEWRSPSGAMVTIPSSGMGIFLPGGNAFASDSSTVNEPEAGSWTGVVHIEDGLDLDIQIGWCAQGRDPGADQPECFDARAS
jgi:hypothetical protein